MPTTKCGKNSTAISVMCRSKKICSTSNMVSGADLGGEGGWHQYIHLSMDFKGTDVTINRQKLLKVIKHFQIPHSVVIWTGRSNCKACEMEWQTVGQFKGTF